MCLAAAACVVALAPGCGGGDDSSADAGPPSKAEFIAKANAACRETRALMAKDRREFERARAGTKPEPGSVDMVHLVYIPAMEDQVTRIELLREPRGQAEQIDELLDVARRSIDNSATDLRIPSIAEAEPYFAKSDRLYRAYGLDDCANKGTGGPRDGA
jgi:hypothetical protein